MTNARMCNVVDWRFFRMQQRAKRAEIIKELISTIPNFDTTSFDLDRYEKQVSQKGNVGVIRDDQSVFGIVIFYSNNKLTATGFVSLIAVNSSRHESGIGTSLMAAALEKMKTAGMTSVELEVHPSNLRAINFYQCFGFMASSQKKDAITMSAQLILN